MAMVMAGVMMGRSSFRLIDSLLALSNALPTALGRYAASDPGSEVRGEAGRRPVEP